jgi:hypothetical protein
MTLSFSNLAQDLKDYADDTRYVLGFLSIVSMICIFLLYLDFKYKSKSMVNESEVIGYITYKKKVIQRKANSTVVWYDTEFKQALTRRDSVRSEDLSNAVITLTDGTELRLEENSMVILDTKEKGIEIKLVSGAVRTNRKNAKTNTEIKVLVDNKNIDLASGADANFRLTENGNLSLNVTQGEANIQSAGKEFKIEKDQFANFRETEAPVFKTTAPTLVLPEDQTFFTTANDAFPVSFQWNFTNTKSNFRIEIAADRNFKKILSRAVTDKNQYSATLKPGIYYWRILPDKNTPNEISLERSFTILKESAFELLRPANNAKLLVANYPTLVSFDWKENSLVKDYTLELSRNSEFTEIIKSTKTTGNHLSQEIKESGEYYYRFQIQYANPDLKPKTSSVYKVSLESKITLEPPILKLPYNESIVIIPKDSKETINLFWERVEGANDYHLQVSTSPDFTNLEIDEKRKENFYYLNPKETDTRYYWRVATAANENKLSDFSKTNFFNSKRIEEFSIELVIPKDNFLITDYDEDLEFQWKTFLEKPFFVVEFSESSDMKDIFKHYNTKSYYQRENYFPSGKFYWRAKLFDNNKKLKAQSKIQSFEIPAGAFDLKYIPKIKTAKDLYFINE